jgi:hypothetical protein
MLLFIVFYIVLSDAYTKCAHVHLELYVGSRSTKVYLHGSGALVLRLG